MLFFVFFEWFRIRIEHTMRRGNGWTTNYFEEPSINRKNRKVSSPFECPSANINDLITGLYEESLVCIRMATACVCIYALCIICIHITYLQKSNLIASSWREEFDVYCITRWLFTLIEILIRRCTYISIKKNFFSYNAEFILLVLFV